MIRSIFIVFLVILVSCDQERPLHEQQSSSKEDISSEYLISVEESHELIKNHPDSVRLIHIGKKESYDKEHIPGAIQFWRPDYSDTQGAIQGLMANEDQVLNILKKIGYEDDLTLLIYGTKANVDAMRFAWILELYGITNFKIINGGLKYWKMNDLEISSEIPETRDSLLDENIILKKDLRTYAGLEDLRSALNDKDHVIVDTREEYEFKGEPFISGDQVYMYKNKAFDRGKIPGAVHLNWSQLTDLNGDHRLKSKMNLYYDLEQRGISKDKKIIVYCQSGSRSSHTLFILKHVLGFPNVKNYDGSWIEWSYYHDLDGRVPIEQICSQDSFDLKFAELKNKISNTSQ